MAPTPARAGVPIVAVLPWSLITVIAPGRSHGRYFSFRWATGPTVRLRRSDERFVTCDDLLVRVVSIRSGPVDVISRRRRRAATRASRANPGVAHSRQWYGDRQGYHRVFHLARQLRQRREPLAVHVYATPAPPRAGRGPESRRNGSGPRLPLRGSGPPRAARSLRARRHGKRRRGSILTERTRAAPPLLARIVSSGEANGRRARRCGRAV